VRERGKLVPQTVVGFEKRESDLMARVKHDLCGWTSPDFIACSLRAGHGGLHQFDRQPPKRKRKATKTEEPQLPKQMTIEEVYGSKQV
jgi:hypothetical protein